jgi:hypothetical protein
MYSPKPLPDLIVLSIEIYIDIYTNILSVIILPMKSRTKTIHRKNIHR